MQHQNITLKLKKPFLQKVKIRATQEHSSMSALMEKALQYYLHQEEHFEKSKKKALKHLEIGLPAGEKLPYSKRAELYTRHD